ncbi:MAG: glycogen debranching enzyme N-terminal domain-containing protein [Desulfobacterales bacterium]|nr:glycogen debranching enzyme N-terminal domain-containing protein [Desulfobacterales bacterium]
MTDFPELTQNPLPGEPFVMFCGDLFTFTLELSFEVIGDAWVRTDLGGAVKSRTESIKKIENDEIKLNGAWYDYKMEKKSSTLFVATLPLNEVGHFQAKCFFLKKNSNVPVWPTGENTIINVESAGTCCSNIIYNAFVRQFGKTKRNKDDDLSLVNQLDKKNYTVIPESGKFRDLKKRVEFIFSDLGCRVLHLLPIHPTPTTYARMGRFGSPYAALNFTDVDSALIEFDTSATPLEQFMELVDTVHYHHGYLFLDIAINHTGWGSSIHESHPEWLVRDETGRIEEPGAWGTTWADLTKLDYSKKDLWQYMAGIFLLWCSRGVDGFRCDAGYMIPCNAWKYIISKVRHQYPDTLFLLEGLGGSVDVTSDILNRANFNWAYSELFQNYSRDQIENYLPHSYEISSKYGHMIHYAETHDNTRLAATSKIYAKMRTSLSALLSVSGGFGFANGVEWYADEKIDVHEFNSLNWGSNENQVAHIGKLNSILKSHPTFFNDTQLKLIQKDNGNCIALFRNNINAGKKLLVLINLDINNNTQVTWKNSYFKDPNLPFYDLISENKILTSTIKTDSFFELSPGEVLALSQDKNDLEDLKNQSAFKIPERVYIQKLKAKVLNIYVALNGYKSIKKFDINTAAKEFGKNPVEFIRSLNDKTLETKVILFNMRVDTKRDVMIPPGYFLLILSDSNFRAEIIKNNSENKSTFGYEEALPIDNTGQTSEKYFAIFMPFKTPKKSRKLILKLRIFKKEKTQIYNSSILFLAKFEDLFINTSFTRKKIVNDPSLKFLQTTDKGGMMRASAWWGKLESRYDALIAANLNKEYPENRWILLTRFRIWASYQGYSKELAPDCLEKFSILNNREAKWLFHIPTSEGNYFPIELILKTSKTNNSVKLLIVRNKANNDKHVLSDKKFISLTIRPDIEDRSFHETVKAWKGPEHNIINAVKNFENGFVFEPDINRKLYIEVSSGFFKIEPEWQYNVHYPFEAQRGLDSNSDIFSPGYFSVQLSGNETINISACAFTSDDNPKDIIENDKNLNIEESGSKFSFKDAVYKTLDAFIVNRDGKNSVIAGFPWFLDWGRDSLIFCRALIELERFDQAKGILGLFGKFEQNGTLPNMICGEDTANRETSDAPLWFFACCREIVEKENCHDFLSHKLNGRTVKQILISIADSFLKGTTSKIFADKETFLLFSPSHYTWMDTNYPACSPRQGYPVDIQALWHYALEFLSQIDDKTKRKEWKAKALILQNTIKKLFYIKDKNYFSDCLHADNSTPALLAAPDDALRPNQLLLITLGVIKDQTILIKTLETLMELLVPGAIRSLADREISYPLEIVYDNKVLKNPYYPYSGTYAGDEDTRRKPAYHNGTAWTWQFPLFSEAWFKVFGEMSRDTALAWLGSSISIMRQGAAGYIPEILDGDSPHTPRGCDAQAWGSSELARVINILTKK